MPRTTHGHTIGGRTTPEFSAWSQMIYRCYTKSCKFYRQYGGRGISVCERWLGDEGFSNFLSDMGTRLSPTHSLDRIDNDGNYEPGNCRWATKKEQIVNRSMTHFVTYNGRTMCLTDWARELGIDVSTLAGRFERGQSLEMAMRPGRHFDRPFGEKGPSAKLTESQVLEIRRLLKHRGTKRTRAKPGMQFQDIANLFGVTRHQISMIHRRKAWAHLPDESESGVVESL